MLNVFFSVQVSINIFVGSNVPDCFHNCSSAYPVLSYVSQDQHESLSVDSLELSEQLVIIVIVCKVQSLVELVKQLK